MSAAYSTLMNDAGESERGALALTEGFRAHPAATLVARSADPNSVALRNSGGKPVRVAGELIAEGSSRSGNGASWHELAIYRAPSGKFAVAIKFLRDHGAGCGVHRARLFDDIESASSWLEEFDPSFDISADFDVSDRSISAATMALKAAWLRDCADRLQREYRSLVGELLFRIETEM
jgi:hypothetical protein